MSEPIVISLGGSIINPDHIATNILKQFKESIEDIQSPLIIVVGGGATARNYQKGLKDCGVQDHSKLDWLGIKATYLNAELVHFILNLDEPVIHDPTKAPQLKNRLIASGWKPGWSTDYVAVTLANHYNASKVINITNTPYVYDKDPKEEGAKPLKEISYDEMKKVVGSEWSPGLNMPFDPIAVKLASENNLKVYIASGIDNMRAIIKDEEYEGTLLHN